MLPPFIHVEVVPDGAAEPEDMIATSVVFEDGENLANNVREFSRRLLDARMGHSTEEFTPLKATDATEAGLEGKKVSIQMLKAMIAGN